jgi:hypothetical protein
MNTKVSPKTTQTTSHKPSKNTGVAKTAQNERNGSDAKPKPREHVKRRARRAATAEDDRENVHRPFRLHVVGRGRDARGGALGADS